MIKDKVAIITGASSGIGFATALALSKAGAKVAIGARRVDRLEELAKKISAKPSTTDSAIRFQPSVNNYPIKEQQ